MVLLSIIPWFHSYGLLTMIHITAGGFRLILLPRFEPNAFLRSIQKYKITHSLMVPPLMVFMAKHPLVDQYDLSSLQELFCGSAPLSRETEMAVLKRIPNLKVSFLLPTQANYSSTFSLPGHPSRIRNV